MTKKRYGKTVVTSVSVSPEFAKLIDKHDLSATEVYRRGVAVSLFDKGVPMYQNPKNAQRSRYVNDFMKRIEKDEVLNKSYESIKVFLYLKSKLKSIKKIIEGLEVRE